MLWMNIGSIAFFNLVSSCFIDRNMIDFYVLIQYPKTLLSLLINSENLFIYFLYVIFLHGTSQVVFVVKNLNACAGDIRDLVRSLGQEDPLEEGMATHSGILAWRIPWREAWWATVHRVAESGNGYVYISFFDLYASLQCLEPPALY